MSIQPQDFNQCLIRKIMTLSHPLTSEPTLVTPSLRTLTGVKAVLFDVYGTMLVSASGDIGANPGCNRKRQLQNTFNSCAFSHVASTAGSCGIDLLDRFIGEEREKRQREGIEYPEVDILEIWKRVLEDLMGKGLIHGSIDDEAIVRVAIDYECRVNPVWPMPSLRDTLDYLVASGRKLGIVSNAQFYTPLTLSAFPPTGWKDGRFDERLCMWSYKFREAKPSTRLLRFALRQLEVHYGIQSPEVLCIGNDMLNDILPAAQAGCRTALFAGDRRSYRPREFDPAIAGIIPDVIIVDLKQICDVAPRPP